ncbi:MAG TPA: hypothetical protein VN962_00575 [Polyangia bacterium]|nr:hypothetical protein [Polyangia bacterium]
MTGIGGIRHRIGAAVIVGLTLVLGLTRGAGAAPPRAPVTLTWEAPAGCPTVEEVTGELAGELDRTPPKAGASPSLVTAAVQVAADSGDSWQGRLTLNVQGARSERRFQAESCDAVASAAALIIAVALDEASERPAPPAPPPLEVASRPLPPPVPTRRATFATAYALMDVDTMPAPPAPGIEMAVGRKWMAGRWRPSWIAGASLFPWHPAPSTDALGALRGDFWQYAVSGRGCLGATLSAVELAPCLGGEVVGMRSGPSGTAADLQLESVTRFWFAFLGSLTATYQGSPSIALVVRADLVVPTAHPAFRVQDTPFEAYRVRDAAVRGALGFSFLFD